MTPRRTVTVERNRLRFAAAHMATFRGECEPLHGHNYDVMVEVSGDLTEDSWVWDFGELKELVRDIVAVLDHRFILQAKSRVLDLEERDGAWEVRFQDRRYVFPAADVAVLPIDNTTAERLAEWVAGQLAEALRAKGATHIEELRVGVEEMPGQAGWYTVFSPSTGG
jgi:6-pyruvoyltetrahydropterin/6-carboxytetrahydropterin synthase